MALDAIQDILADWPGRATLAISRGDETSGQGNGRIRVRELRDPRWMLTAQSRILRPNLFAYWKARLDSLDGEGLFFGYDLRGKYPASYPDASWPTGELFNGLTATIKTIGGDGKSVALENLPAGFALTIGDKFSAEYGEGSPAALMLLETVEAATANGSGVTPTFAVRPPLAFGAEVAATVRLIFPRCHMMITPGSINAQPDDLGWGTISFQADQVITP